MTGPGFERWSCHCQSKFCKSLSLRGRTSQCTCTRHLRRYLALKCCKSCICPLRVETATGLYTDKLMRVRRRICNDRERISSWRTSTDDEDKRAVSLRSHRCSGSCRSSSSSSATCDTRDVVVRQCDDHAATLHSRTHSQLHHRRTGNSIRLCITKISTHKFRTIFIVRHGCRA